MLPGAYSLANFVWATGDGRKLVIKDSRLTEGKYIREAQLSETLIRGGGLYSCGKYL
jgi:hypothetical protein